MSTTVMSIKTDKQLKENAQKLAKDLGFPLGTLINAFLRQFVRDETVHFGKETSYPLKESIAKELVAIEKDIREGKNMSPKFDNAKDAIRYLRHAK